MELKTRTEILDMTDEQLVAYADAADAEWQRRVAAKADEISLASIKTHCERLDLMMAGRFRAQVQAKGSR